MMRIQIKHLIVDDRILKRLFFVTNAAIQQHYAPPYLMDDGLQFRRTEHCSIMCCSLDGRVQLLLYSSSVPQQRWMGITGTNSWAENEQLL